MLKGIFSRWFERAGEPLEEHGDYRVYDTRHDELVGIGDLLKSLPSRRWAHAAEEEFLSRMAPQVNAMISQAIAASDALRRTEFAEETWAVTLLIDHSGSMKGTNAQLAALIAQGFLALVESLDCRFEILGFTTVDWHGGAVRLQWNLAGKPRNPGRLCALRHIVYSSFGSTGKPTMAGLFAPEVFRENVDGEALEWAVARLRAQPASRRLLVYVSDGAPVDDSTLRENPPDYLWQHLQSVLSGIAAAKDVDLAAIGLQHRVETLVPGAILVKGFQEVLDKVVPYLAARFAAGPERGAVGGPEGPPT